jgi:hypothetical protein
VTEVNKTGTVDAGARHHADALPGFGPKRVAARRPGGGC